MTCKNKYVVLQLRKGIDKRVRSRLVKMLMGNTVTINGRKYRVKGLIENLNGKHLCPGTYLVPLDKYDYLREHLREKGLEKYLVETGTCTCT